MMTKRSFQGLSGRLVLALTMFAGVSAGWQVPGSAAQAGPPPPTDLENRGLYPQAYIPGELVRHEDQYAEEALSTEGALSTEWGLNTWSRVIFASYRDNNYEVYSMNSDGSALTRLTNQASADYQPDLNRGATRVLFVSDRNGNPEIYVMNADGSGLARLTANSAYDFMPSWSPDGSRIVFYSNRDGNYEIYVMNANGSGQARLTINSSMDFSPAWSPDGSKIVFASNRGNYYALWTMNADGSNQQQLTPAQNFAAFPDWSPDGSRIVFANDLDGNGWMDLARIDANGANLTQLGFYGSSDFHTDYSNPAWDPSGRYVAFMKIQYTYYQNEWYWVHAWVNYHDTQSVWLDEPGLVSGDREWYPEWQTADTTSPVVQMNTLPQWSPGIITVQWSGADTGGADMLSYDVQYRVGTGGVWTDLLVNTTQTSVNLVAVDLVGGGLVTADGISFFFRARGRDKAHNLSAYPGGNGHTSTTVDRTAPTVTITAPTQATSLAFPVTWSASDTGAGVASYDVQVRDLVTTTWTNWLLATTQTSHFYNGELDHTYQFRVCARDRLGNQSDYASSPIVTTTTPSFSLSGQVFNNRGNPIVGASVFVTPSALNTVRSLAQGRFTAFFNAIGTVTLTAAHPGYGPLPPLANVPITAVEPIHLYLPPANDLVANGQFETGDLSGWLTSGMRLSTVVTGHTGTFAARLGGPMSDTTTTVQLSPRDAAANVVRNAKAGPWLSTVKQVIQSPIAPLVSGTLSLAYRADSAQPLSDTFSVAVAAASQSMTWTLPLTPAGWQHIWLPLPNWVIGATAPTFTLSLIWSQDDPSSMAGVVVDEVSAGSSLRGMWIVYLPSVMR